MRYRDDISPEYVRQSFSYDPETGVLMWKVRPDRTKKWNQAWAGAEAGTPSCGYIHVRLHGAKAAFGAHRLAWVHFYGAWPESEIDHINRIGTDNRIANLRLATRSQNMSNTRKRKQSRSGYTGVTFHKQSGKWQARVCVDYKSRFLGLFPSAEEAAAARDKVARAIHGEFAKTNS